MEAPIRSVTPPSWDLLKVLEFLKSPVFEPLHQASLRDLTRKTLFLTALASAKELASCRLYRGLCPFLPQRLQCLMFQSLFLKLSQLCGPSPALLLFNLSLISRPACLTKCYCVLSGPYQSMLRGLQVLSTGLGGSLCRLVLLLAQCRRMTFLICCERLLYTLEPAPMMSPPLKPIVFGHCDIICIF